MEELAFDEKQEKMIDEVMAVFKANDADLFEIYRVLEVLRTILREYVVEHAVEMLDVLEEIFESLNEESE